MAAGGAAANPFRSGDLFVGRKRDLGQVEGLLRQGQSVLLVGGRRAGKTTLTRQVSADRIQRTLVRTDVTGWDLTSMSSCLGALLSAIEGLPLTAHAAAERKDIVLALEATAPVSLVIDEADRLLLASSGPSFFSFLRWLDDAHLRSQISILLVGGPVLILFKDPDDKGSPPLNTAEPYYLSPLGRDAVAELAQVCGQAEQCDEILRLCGGHAWLTTRLLAEMWDGASLQEAADDISDRSIGTFEVWERQLGPLGRELLRRLPPDGVADDAFRKAPWTGYRSAAVFSRSIGLIRRDGSHIHHGPQLFLDWFVDAVPHERVWDLAISYASQDESLAREIHEQLRDKFDVFYAPAQHAPLWGSDLNRVLPNTYGVQSSYVLVLSTQNYVDKYWTKVEYDAVASHAPNRILLLDMGALPAELPPGLVYRGSSAAEMVSLVDALQQKLTNHHDPHVH
jgi:hypothetical protein